MTAIEFYSSFDKVTSSLNSFAYNLTKNFEEAKDLYQETAYRALTNRDKFNPGTNFKAWLFTIMKNIFINNYIDNEAGQNILLKELEAMIERLDDSIRIPFMMHYVGHKYQEIAEELDLPLGTIKSRIFFARKELKEMIRIHYGDLTTVRERLTA